MPHRVLSLLHSWGAPVNMDDTKRASAAYPMDETGNWEGTAAYTHQGAIFAYAPAHLYDPCESEISSTLFVNTRRLVAEQKSAAIRELVDLGQCQHLGAGHAGAAAGLRARRLGADDEERRGDGRRPIPRPVPYGLVGRRNVVGILPHRHERIRGQRRACRAGAGR